MKLIILLLALNFNHPSPKHLPHNIKAHYCKFKDCPYKGDKKYYMPKMDYYDLEPQYYIDSIHFRHPSAPLQQVKKYVYERFFTFTN